LVFIPTPGFYFFSFFLLDFFQKLLIEVGVNHAPRLSLVAEQERATPAGYTVIDLRSLSPESLSPKKWISKRLPSDADHITDPLI